MPSTHQMMRRGHAILLGGAFGLVACTRLREIADKPPAKPAEAAEASVSTPAKSAAESPAPSDAQGVVAFPGAEGFGARARGGRGGTVCRVTTLAHAGSGSLQACFDTRGPRTVIFDVSGVIEGPLEIKYGQLTVAGQTSPNGVVIKGGIVCDNVYDPNDCNDVIFRHLRLRGGTPDSLRLSGAHDIIVDHCSMAGAEDENVEVTRSRNITIQHSVIAEPRGDHYQWGGVLINYSTDVTPLENITIHHSVWNGVAGRLPEISCEENGDGRGKSNCAGRVASIELANNVLFDVSDPIWFNRCTGNNEGNDCAANAPGFSIRLNLVGNVMVRRSSADADAPFAGPLFAHRGNSIFAADNQLFRGPSRVGDGGRGTLNARHAFPIVTYTPSNTLVTTLARTAGAFPRDKMDTRLAAYLGKPVDARPAAWRGGNGIDQGDALALPIASASAPIKDSNADGIPDGYQTKACASGYTPLECYLNELADSRTPR